MTAPNKNGGLIARGSLRPSASVPAGAVIQGEGDRQERRE